ncbi:MAG: hydantoinase B/oxoprolinase family protein, partial [Rhodospirillales bacterium]|nr:hydantoinase B/oxoprolinase family protein [Rhodospirillales bacterium]
LRRYVDQVQRDLEDVSLMFMQSNGGLTSATLFRGKDSILSGPAAGVVAAAGTTAMAGFDKVIGFDMGGTSTDVSHYAGVFERAFETQVAGVRLRSPIMQIHTVAAGGGSLLHFDGARFRVGPTSAGADPGPACYGRGGPLTVTDANVSLGRIQPSHFPHVFGEDGKAALDLQAARQKLQALTVEVNTGLGSNLSAEEVAEGFLKIAVENMANAIKKVSVQRGYDVTEYTLACFGGAGGQHACQVADALGMTTVHIHPFAGVLSAYGMGLAEITAHRERTVEQKLTAGLETTLNDIADDLADDIQAELARQDMAADRVRLRYNAHLRYTGTDTALDVPLGPAREMAHAFQTAHRVRFGFADPGRDIIVGSLTIEGTGVTEKTSETNITESTQAPQPIDTVPLHLDGTSGMAPVFNRDTLCHGDTVLGPAIMTERTGTTIVKPGWAAKVNAQGHLILTRLAPRDDAPAIGTNVNPVMLEVFNNLFMSIAEQMGAVLANTASSVNIKERLDFSCAIFDAAGGLIANAPHLPVHLGSMGESVQTIIRQRANTIRDGQVFALNAPYNGGTHLPDITVITPVFDATGQTVLFYLGARGHHADVGGITPGSIPAFSSTVNEEGVLIDDFLLVQTGRLRETELREMLASGPHPARDIDQNVADFRAQIAANEKGVQELLKMVEHFGLEVVQAYMQHVKDNAAESVRRVLDALPDGSFALTLDHGGTIKVSITVDKDARRAKVDFSGTSSQVPTNFNAPLAVCRAAVLYVFRCLVQDDIPLNDGCLDPLELVVPEGSFLNPAYPAAVVAGNVETSQAITSVLFGATGALAAGQTTMNNLTFGNAEHQYYETICGGAGAGVGFNGASAVHTHMTNTRLTDPEILEWRYPVLLEDFRIREQSGGDGAYRGGDGAIRRLRFLDHMTASIVSSTRETVPFGLQGGGAGQPGRNYVERTDGSVTALKGADQTEMAPGDVLVIETPGGGGFGRR